MKVNANMMSFELKHKLSKKEIKDLEDRVMSDIMAVPYPVSSNTVVEISFLEKKGEAFIYIAKVSSYLYGNNKPLCE